MNARATHSLHGRRREQGPAWFSWLDPDDPPPVEQAARGDPWVSREEAAGAGGIGARLVELHAELRGIAPAVSRWLCMSPSTRGPMPVVRMRAHVEALLAEMAELAART